MAKVGRGHRFEIHRGDLERMYVREGMSCRAIGEVFGCSWDTVRLRLVEHGIPLRSKSVAGTLWVRTPESNRKRSEAHKKLWDKRGRRSSEHVLHLQRGEWKRRAQECYARDNWTCRNCGVHCTAQGKTRIQAHHVVSRIRGGSDDLDNLKTLCASCHTREERAA